jgi:hypothetical protein
MAVMTGKDWRTDFGIADRNPPYFFGEKATLDATSRPVPQAHAMRRAFDSMQLDGILLLQNSLAVYFKEVAKIQPQQMRSLQRRFWNQGLSPVLVVIDPQDVYIYSGLTPPPDDEVDANHGHQFVKHSAGLLKRQNCGILSFPLSRGSSFADTRRHSIHSSG